MVKRSIDEILYDSLPENVTKRKLGIEKCLRRSFVARKIKYLEFISGNKVALFSRLINRYFSFTAYL